MLLSIIVPCFNEEQQIFTFYHKIAPILQHLCNNNYEIIFVDDGSQDKSLVEMEALHKNYDCIEYLSFSRNFGKEAAMLAGMEASHGEYVAMMDVDLQDPPEMLPSMLDCLLSKNYDCVATRRVTRKGEPVIRSLFARIFYTMINKISDIEVIDGARDFRLMTKQMVQAIISMPERNRFSKGIFAWVGFKTRWMEYENQERVSGQSKWSFGKLFLYSLDGIFAFSTVPLAIASIMGILLCIGSFLAILYFVYQKLFIGIATEGWAMMMCAILMLGGVQLFCIGILGQYVAKTYIETKGRPLYVIRTSSKSEVNCCDLESKFYQHS